MADLRSLPVAGIMNAGQTVRQAREALKVTLLLLAQIEKDPAGLHHSVRQALADIAFHVRVGLSLIDTYVGMGYSLSDPIEAVEGLSAALHLHAAAVAQAKYVWDFAQKSAAVQGDLPLRALTAPRVEGRAPAVGSFGDDVLSEPKVQAYVGMAAVGLGVLGLYYLVK